MTDTRAFNNDGDRRVSSENHQFRYVGLFSEPPLFQPI